MPTFKELSKEQLQDSLFINSQNNLRPIQNMPRSSYSQSTLRNVFSKDRRHHQQRMLRHQVVCKQQNGYLKKDILILI
jgi:hypothetical protein